MKKVRKTYRRAFTFQCIALLTTGFQSTRSAAQQQNSNIKVLPMGNWIEYRQAQYRGTPILVHLRIGYERAILMPEAVWIQNPEPGLPGCDVVVNNDIVGFYPTRYFTRRAVKLVGEDSGDTYELLVSASVSGVRQPLQINRS